MYIDYENTLLSNDFYYYVISMENNPLNNLFNDKEFVEKIQNLLPQLFEIAEIESSRAGKTGMEVGNLRERILVSMFIHKFGTENVKTEIPTTEPEVDVIVFDEELSIKTITNKYFTGVKLSWTVDYQKAVEFIESYEPLCSLFLVQINWEFEGGLFYGPVNIQNNVLEKLGKENYFKLPKQGTNPRGVEITKEALEMLIKDKSSKTIPIFWEKRNLNYNPYKRWLDYWSEGINEIK